MADWDTSPGRALPSGSAVGLPHEDPKWCERLLTNTQLVLGNGISFPIHPDVSGLSSEMSATGKPGLSLIPMHGEDLFYSKAGGLLALFFAPLPSAKLRHTCGSYLGSQQHEDEGSTLELPSLLLHGQTDCLQSPSRSPCLAVSASVSPDNRRT